MKVTLKRMGKDPGWRLDKAGVQAKREEGSNWFQPLLTRQVSLFGGSICAGWPNTTTAPVPCQRLTATHRGGIPQRELYTKNWL